MTISCPKCELSKDLGKLNIPSTGTTATCPRCGTEFAVFPECGESAPKRWRYVLIVTVVAAGLLLIFYHDWKLDKNYYLQPSAWQGEMIYLGVKHPFDMAIEKAQDGKLEGYMDWVETSPRYRLAIRGTYIGNHLIFEDYKFIERGGATGLHDVQDVYIVGNEMTGTAKGGAADFHALKRESAPF